MHYVGNVSIQGLLSSVISRSFLSEGEEDSASRAGFAVTTAPDSNPLKSSKWS